MKNEYFQGMMKMDLRVRITIYFFAFVLCGLAFVTIGESQVTNLETSKREIVRDDSTARLSDSTEEVRSRYVGAGALAEVLPKSGTFERTKSSSFQKGSNGNIVSPVQVGRTILSLVLVIAFILGSLYLLKRMTGGGSVNKGNGALIQVMATNFIGPKKAISIVKVAGEMLVLGITNTEITFLSKIDSPEAVKEVESIKVSEGLPFVKVFEKFGFAAKRGER